MGLLGDVTNENWIKGYIIGVLLTGSILIIAMIMIFLQHGVPLF